MWCQKWLQSRSSSCVMSGQNKNASPYCSNMYNFVFCGNGIIETKLSNVHANGTPNKEIRKVLKFTSCVEVILMVLSKHYQLHIFPPLWNSVAKWMINAVYIPVSLYLYKIGSAWRKRDLFFAPYEHFNTAKIWCEILFTWHNHLIDSARCSRIKEIKYVGI